MLDLPGAVLGLELRLKGLRVLDQDRFGIWLEEDFGLRLFNSVSDYRLDVSVS